MIVRVCMQWAKEEKLEALRQERDRDVQRTKLIHNLDLDLKRTKVTHTHWAATAFGAYCCMIAHDSVSNLPRMPASAVTRAPAWAP